MGDEWALNVIKGMVFHVRSFAYHDFYALKI